jgi:hypothetical protein
MPFGLGQLDSATETHLEVSKVSPDRPARSNSTQPEIQGSAARKSSANQDVRNPLPGKCGWPLSPAVLLRDGAYSEWRATQPTPLRVTPPPVAACQTEATEQYG